LPLVSGNRPGIFPLTFLWWYYYHHPLIAKFTLSLQSPYPPRNLMFKRAPSPISNC
jgi:hypothetical protein